MGDVTERKNEHGTPSGVVKEKNLAPKSDDAQATKNSEMDRKLKRTIANRLAAQKYRLKKTGYVGDLQCKVKSLQERITMLIPQIQVEQSRCQSLLIEQQTLKFYLDASEKHRQLQEAETEKKRAEVEMLKEQLKLATEAKAKLNMDTYMLMMSNSRNSYPSGFGGFNHLNLTPAANGEGTSRGEIDNVHQPQTQSQMGIVNKPIIPDLNLRAESDSEFEEE